jgi:hypothetical protein
MGMKRSILIAISLAFLFTGANDEARAQQLNSQLPNLSNAAGDLAQASPSRLLAQALRSQQKGFSLMSESSSAGVKLNAPALSILPTTAMAAVTGSGTSGRLSKWSGVNGSSTFVLGDSNIFEDKFGKVGIGTTTPTSPLTVNGVIESTSGGFKFPDGSVQTTSAAGALFTVAHDNTLVGDGTPASPLGVAVPVEELFQKEVSIPVANNTLNATASFTVPANKRLVIEFIAARYNLPSPGFSLLDLQIKTSVGGQTATYMLVPIRTLSFGGLDVWVASQQVSIRADPGSTVTLFVGFPTLLTNGAAGFFSLSGRLINVP